MLPLKQFGGKPGADDIRKYERSANWKDGRFHNLVETTIDMKLYEIPGLIYQQMTEKNRREPPQPLPMTKFDREAFLDDSNSPGFIWFGHSAVLLRLEGKTIFIDPMMGPNASPIAPIATKRFTENTLEIIDELPEIDLVLLTHDHYDHLDMASIEKLASKVSEFWVAIGCSRHLTAWDIAASSIREFDWWNTEAISDVTITFTPTRHFSGRGLKDRAKSLWGGWVLKTEKHSIWFSGDSGYAKHFEEIGRRLGPFDLAFMECGQYDRLWGAIHMTPEEAVQAAIDAQVVKSVPVHWGGFSLAMHSWEDPPARFTTEAHSKHVEIMLPRLGQSYAIQESCIEPWWQEHMRK